MSRPGAAERAAEIDSGPAVIPVAPAVEPARADSQARATTERDARSAALDDFFIPDLCANRSVFAVVLTAELIAVTLSLARPSADFLMELARISMFLQWLGLTSARAVLRALGLLLGRSRHLFLLLVARGAGLRLAGRHLRVGRRDRIAGPARGGHGDVHGLRLLGGPVAEDDVPVRIGRPIDLAGVSGGREHPEEQGPPNGLHSIAPVSGEKGLTSLPNALGVTV